MIIGDKREQVINNIKHACEANRFDEKVEVDDPAISPAERKQLLKDYLKRHKTLCYKINNLISKLIISISSIGVNRLTKITGLENIAGISGGAIVTSNHFNPIDNLIVRNVAKIRKTKRLYVVSQETNLMMTGLFGFLIKYSDILPICKDHHYIVNHFDSLIGSVLHHGDLVLIYPEQEMWFNYRKPRPLKPGAYHYAAKFNVPIISCFVQITDLPNIGTKGFRKTAYTLHILKTIYPDPLKTVKENRIEMCKQDYQQKKEAYEKAYRKPLDYHFDPADIAGWIPSEPEFIPAAEAP